MLRLRLEAILVLASLWSFVVLLDFLWENFFLLAGVDQPGFSRMILDIVHLKN